MFRAPHGAVCAALLPHGIEVNIRVLRARDPAGETLHRYETVARLLTGRPQARAEEFVEWTWEICRELQIPSLRAHGVRDTDWPVLVEKAARASSMEGNPVVLTPDQLRQIIKRASGGELPVVAMHPKPGCVAQRSMWEARLRRVPSSLL